MKQVEEQFSTLIQDSIQTCSKVLNMTTLITGSTGFVGKWILLAWLSAAEMLGGQGRLILVVRNPAKLAPVIEGFRSKSRISTVALDLREPFQEINETFDVIVHAGTSSNAADYAKRPFETARTILAGQDHAIRWAMRSNLKQLVLVSSGAVYGENSNPGLRFSEDSYGQLDYLAPEAIYAEMKRAAEAISSAAQRDGLIEVISLRLFAFLAPFLPLNQHFAAGNFIRDVIKGQDIHINGDGTAVRSYQYGTDLAHWIWTAIAAAPISDSFNIGSSEAVTIRNLAELIIDIVNPSVQFEIQNRINNSSSKVYVPDVSKFKQKFNVVNTVGLREAIERTAEWARHEGQLQ